MSAPHDLGDDEAQAMAAMSCCPAGALVVLGQVAARWWATRRLHACRRREISMLVDMWNG